jgi:prophage regulatory protein
MNYDNAESSRACFRLERLPRVMMRTGLSRSALYESIKQGRFPRPVPIGARAVAWSASEVDEWIAGRLRAPLVR